MFERRAPYHLEELKLIDLKVSPIVSHNLLNSLQQKCYLRKLALINVQISQNFAQLLTYIEECQYLEFLTLNWCEVNHREVRSLVQTLSKNQRLREINLEWNVLLEQNL
jgi:hypothetical protein